MRNSKGFTLVELLIVVAILSMLVAMLLPTLGKAKDLARDVVCQSNLRSMWPAMRFFAEDHEGYLPPVAHATHGTWNQLLANYGKDNSGWAPETSYTAKENFECPSYEYESISRRGCYGMNWAMANYDSEGQGNFIRNSWPNCEYLFEATLRPAHLYLVGDTSRWAPYGGHQYTFLRLSGSSTPRFRHLGNHPEGHCNVLFHDSHVEPLEDMQIPGQVYTYLPWFNREDYFP